MPILTTTVSVDAEIDFSVYCGICGRGCCGDTFIDEKRSTITVTCPECEKKINELEERIEQLEDELNADHRN